MSNVKWGEYKISDLFDVKTTKSKDKNKIVFEKNGDYEFIGRSYANNGIQGYVNHMEYEPNPAKTFSLVQVGETVMLYRANEWYASQNIFILTPKDKNAVDNHLFFETAVNKSLYMYSDAYVYPTLDDVKNHKILLPINESGNIDYKFMNSYISELENSNIEKVSNYLDSNNLTDCILTSEEENVLNDYEKIKFEEFNITDVFDIKNTKNILSRDVINDSGTVPYLCASTENNAVTSYISYRDDLKDKGNCIFIGGKTFVVTYQPKDFYSNDSHNLALYLKESTPSKFNQLFLATCVNSSLSGKYSWGDSVSNSKIKHDKISLPSVNGKIDFKTMELLISGIEKIIFKDFSTRLKSKLK